MVEDKGPEAKSLLQTTSVEFPEMEESQPLLAPVHGLTVVTCALFIVGEMAGSGVLAIPRAFANSGWTGIGLLVICCFVSLYCGILLGECWRILRNKKSVYKAYPRDPYPSIGYECFGSIGKGIVEFCLLVTLFGVCVVFLLIASENISSLVNRKIGYFSGQNESRAWLLIVSACVLPFTYLGTPKDFWLFALFATLSTSTACVLIVVKTALDWPVSIASVPQEKVTVETFFSAFGTIAFSFGGATLFPSFQSDMKEPEKFPFAAILGFLIVLVMYLPTGLLPFMVYGENLKPNVLQTIKSQGDTGAVKNLAIVAEILITAHLVFSFVITLNPISQQVEEYLKWPQRFGWRRCLIRTTILIIILGFAEAVPKFGPILSLIGGSTVTLMAFILPCIFYLKLKSDVPMFKKILNFEIIAVALVSGGAATYSAILGIKDTFK